MTRADDEKQACMLEQIRQGRADALSIRPCNEIVIEGALGGSE